jgi:glycosyltransferase involved in cell wall biosynthesis
MENCQNLRVLIVGTYPPPYGGIATHLTSLVPGLSKRNAEDVAIVTMGEQNKVDHIKGAIVYRYTSSKHIFQIFNPANWILVFYVIKNFIGSSLGFKEIIREAIKAILVNEIAVKHNSNVVAFYHSDAHFEMIPLSNYWGKKRRIILAVFGEVYGSPNFMKTHKKIIEKMILVPNSIWASSDHCANSFKNLDITRSLNTIYLGVDLEEANDLVAGKNFRSQNNITPGDIVVMFLGRFLKDMGLDVLLKIIPSILSENPAVKFILAGAKGDLSEKAKSMSDSFPSRIIIIQDFPFSMQKSLYNACDIVVAPSFDQRACMGLSIKEAMATKKPVVATYSGGIPEAVIHGETGFLVPLDVNTKSADLQKLEEYLMSLITDPSMRKKFGDNGREVAEKLFAVDVTIDKVCMLLNGRTIS